MIADGNAHILLVRVESGFAAAVARQDVELFQHLDNDTAGPIGGQHLTEEVVGLRRHDTQEGNAMQLLFKTVALGNEFLAGSQVVLLVLVVDLHEELGKGVEVPDCHLFLNARNERFVCRCQDA